MNQRTNQNIFTFLPQPLKVVKSRKYKLDKYRINSIKLVFQYFQYFYLLFRPLFKWFLKLGQKYKNIFEGFLVQTKTLKVAFDWKVEISVSPTFQQHPHVKRSYFFTSFFILSKYLEHLLLRLTNLCSFRF